MGDPGHHDTGGIGIGKSILYQKAVERVRIIRRPDLVGVTHDAQVNPASTSGATFDLNLWMFRTQLGEDRVKILHIGDVDLLLVFRSRRRPSWFGPVAVIVPLEKGDAILIQEFVEKSKDIVTHIR